MCWFLPHLRLFKPFSFLITCTHISPLCDHSAPGVTQRQQRRRLIEYHVIVCVSTESTVVQLSAICSGDESSQHQNQLDSI